MRLRCEWTDRRTEMRTFCVISSLFSRTPSFMTKCHINVDPIQCKPVKKWQFLLSQMLERTNGRANERMPGFACGHVYIFVLLRWWSFSGTIHSMINKIQILYFRYFLALQLQLHIALAILYVIFLRILLLWHFLFVLNMSGFINPSLHTSISCFMTIWTLDTHCTQMPVCMCESSIWIPLEVCINLKTFQIPKSMLYN